MLGSVVIAGHLLLLADSVDALISCMHGCLRCTCACVRVCCVSIDVTDTEPACETSWHVRTDGGLLHTTVTASATAAGRGTSQTAWHTQTTCLQVQVPLIIQPISSTATDLTQGHMHAAEAEHLRPRLRSIA